CALWLSRMRATLVMSTRWTVVTCAEVRLDITMCSAILTRMVLMGSMRVLACPAGGSGATAGGAAGPAAGSGAGAGAAGPGCAAVYASTSCLVIRPPAPVPFTCARSRLSSRAILRTKGESGPAGSLPAGSGGGAGAATAGLAGGTARTNTGGPGGSSRGGSSGGGSNCAGGAAFINARDYGVDADCLAFLHQDLGKRAGGRGGNLGVHLVGGNLKERLVALDALAGLFVPLGQGAFHNAFAHLGHDDVGHISSPSRDRKSGRSERRVWRPPRRGLHGRRARPWRSRAGSIRKERCTEN